MKKPSAEHILSIVNKSSHPLPSYESAAAAGLDLRAHLLDRSIWLDSLGRVLIPTGLYIELPIGYEAQIRPRSGLALKQGLTLLNSPGTIDADYRGEIKVLMVNLSEKRVEIQDGSRIAQLVLSAHERVQWKEVEALSSTHRGEKGFGSTGIQ